MGSIFTCLGMYLTSFWGHLASFVMSRVSFWVPQASKMHPSDVQASVMKTYENLGFLLILEGWEALVATRNGIWKLTGWLGWPSRLAGQAGEDSGSRGYTQGFPGTTPELREPGKSVVKGHLPGPNSNQPDGYKLPNCKTIRLQATRLQTTYGLHTAIL